MTTMSVMHVSHLKVIKHSQSHLIHSVDSLMTVRVPVLDHTHTE